MAAEESQQNFAEETAVTQVVQETAEESPRRLGTNYLYLWISLVIIALDQLSKYLIRSRVEYGEIIRITPKLLWITHVRNTGAAFSFSFGSPELNKVIFITVSLLAIILILVLIRKTTAKLELVSYALILGGAVGNLIDRILLGGVTDFIWCDFPDFIMPRWPVFNVADSSIVVAITLMLIYTVFFSNRVAEDK